MRQAEDLRLSVCLFTCNSLTLNSNCHNACELSTNFEISYMLMKKTNKYVTLLFPC